MQDSSVVLRYCRQSLVQYYALTETYASKYCTVQ